MSLLLSPAKLVLLAVHCAVNGDIDSLTTLAGRHTNVLRKDLLLRILLTYLPETLPSSRYIDLIRYLGSGDFPDPTNAEVDCSAVEDLEEDQAAKKVRKLRLLPLTLPETQDTDSSISTASEDSLSLFLLRRSYKVDEEAGLLDELPALLLPFLNHSPHIRSLLVSAVLPLLRRNCEYYPQDPISYALHDFEQLPDRVAVNLLLSHTGTHANGLAAVGRDLRGLIGPWLTGDKRWKQPRHRDTLESPPAGKETAEGVEEVPCPGWDEVLRWLTTQASRNWRIAVNAVQQWDGSGDADLADWGSLTLSDTQREYMEGSYARAALASAYLIPEASLDALDGAYNIISRVAELRDLTPISPLTSELAVLPPLTEQIPEDLAIARNTTYMRNDLLSAFNPLTTPSDASTALLQALTLSAHILTKAGCPCTIRRAGELALLRDEREQKAEFSKLIHTLGNNGPKTDDKFWMKARDDILWLRDWGAEDSWSSEGVPRGVFGQIKREFLEVEVLKVLLSNTRYSLARSIYEDGTDQPLDRKLLQDTIFATAMTAYDNASNPNRTRGGLKKCDEMIKAFPKTIEKSDAHAKRIEALLRATHSLGDYRLVLKQGEPFTPVVLRVHADPISIVGKILEQNPKSYTQLHDFLSLGTHMVEAGLTAPTKITPLTSEEESAHRLTASQRITAMCIDAALAEDDFETAYSYVVNRLPDTPNPASQTPDDYSWKAALQAGKYRRNAHTLPGSTTGIGGGLSSANADVRHLEQRIECLATALRVAPVSDLQEIVNAFRRAEEELEVLVREEQAEEDEWDARGDSLVRPGSGINHTSVMPGGFHNQTTTNSKPQPPRTFLPSRAPAPHASHASSHARRPSRTAATDEDAAPMSLFDLSRASVLSAQRNLSALSGLRSSAAAAAGGLGGRLTRHQNAHSTNTNAKNKAIPAGSGYEYDTEGSARGSADLSRPMSAASGEMGMGSSGGTERVRKRDQLREAAMGTLVSGVGWLVGAPAPGTGAGQERERE
ncbi:protein transport protein sec39 [Dichotomopilus funicola]|uniref:Protein transport protein sec39 n=1 Tax=Dichotomopilus funicola TaxID=1934379 RepID=A0AAN6VA27_9PEZI|nr:protein transport protein sec39 [Dichotomopilus funicola]